MGRLSNTAQALADSINFIGGHKIHDMYQLPPAFWKAADFSSAAYDDINTVGDVRGYSIDRDISTDQFKVFVDEKNKRLVYALRGSSVAKDFLISDAEVMVGKEAVQTREARDHLKHVMARYADYEKEIVGHSSRNDPRLSGITASRLNFENPGMFKRNIVFNPAKFPPG